MVRSAAGQATSMDMGMAHLDGPAIKNLVERRQGQKGGKRTKTPNGRGGLKEVVRSQA